MGSGDDFREITDEYLNEFGQIVIVYNDWDYDKSPSFEATAYDETMGEKPGCAIFCFGEAQDIRTGAVIQVKGARDLWRVVDTKDSIMSGVYLKYEAHAVKISETGKEVYPSSHNSAVFHGPVTGGVQVGGQHNIQNVSINVNPKFDEAISSLMKLINEDIKLDKYQKEDAIEALKKLPDLAKEEQTEGVIKRAKDKLEIVQSIISVSKDLALVAAPYLPAIAEHFHLLS